MSDTAIPRITTWVEGVLDNLVARPDGYGPPFAVEMQFFLALDMLQEIRSVTEGREPVRITSVWSGILKNHGYIPNTPLAEQTKGYEALQKLLPELREALR